MNKTYVEMRVAEAIKSKGGTFLYFNWKKRTAHFLTPGGQKRAESVILPRA